MLNSSEFLCNSRNCLRLDFAVGHGYCSKIILNIMHTGYLYIILVDILGYPSAFIIAKHPILTEEGTVLGLFLDAEIRQITSYYRRQCPRSLIIKAENSS